METSGQPVEIITNETWGEAARLHLDLPDEVCYTEENTATEESRARTIRHPGPIYPEAFDNDFAKFIR